MRGLVTVLATGAVIGLGYWAYDQNIETKETIREVDRLQRQIGEERERLSILRDEWAYLTRPDRLRELAELNFERLELMPMTPEQFGNPDLIAYPPVFAETDLLQDSASGPENRP
ncbi:cell division protein FtsL [Rhodobacterales bacterium HKCCE2091]|nr:cell division protein FtsL [Rhodobacterales bacterium HKCCE2091]